MANFDGDVNRFLGTLEMFDKIFNTSLSQQHIVNKKPPMIKLSSFQQRILSVAQTMQGEKESFFISSLLGYMISAMPKIHKEQIIAGIYDLKEKGFLYPMST